MRFKELAKVSRHRLEIVRHEYSIGIGKRLPTRHDREAPRVSPHARTRNRSLVRAANIRKRSRDGGSRPPGSGPCVSVRAFAVDVWHAPAYLSTRQEPDAFR